MDRAAAALYLDAELGPKRDLAGLAEGAWDAAIDRALLALGLPTTTDPFTGDETAYRAMLEWAGLRLIRRRVDGLNVSIGEPSVSYQWGEAIKLLDAALAEAARAARPYAVAGELLTDAGAAYGRAVVHRHGVYAPC